MVLAGWFALDVGMRFLPPQWFRVNPITIALREPGAYGSFHPRVSLVAPYYAGDAALEANLPATESRPPVRFSTDALGFRLNPFLPEGESPDVVILRGASFIYGSALSDEETLPAVLTRVSGLDVHNGSRSHLDDDNEIRYLDRLLDRLPAYPEMAVVVYLEHENPRRPTMGGGRAAAVAGAVPALAPVALQYQRGRRWLARHHRTVTRWWDFSPLEIMARRLDRGVTNDRILPNEFKRLGRQLALPDGRRMLFRHYELGPVRERRGAAEAAQTADYFEWWANELASRGIETYVLILPSRYTVYGPVLEREPMRETLREAAGYLDAVAAELRARGINTVDAASAFRARAAAEVRTGVLSFYREDNHWNPRGVALVAELLADAMRRGPDLERLYRFESTGRASTR